MTTLRPIVLGLLAGVIAYFGIQRILPGHSQAAIGQVVTLSVSPTSAVSPKVTRGDKRGVTSPVTSVSPSLSPVSPSVSPSPRVSPSLSPTPSPTRTPIPYTSISPTPTPTPIVTASATPSPTALPTPTATQLPPSGNVKVVINEIGWMGTASSYTDEWIELYNAGSDTAELSGWRLAATDGKPDIALTGQIAPGEYYLIERTSDTTISDVAADLVIGFGTGLSDNGEHLRLIMADGSLADDADCSAGWFSGDKVLRASMERIHSEGSGSDASNWATNDASLMIGHDASGGVIRGTPRGQNSVSR